jgi:hypothetical protein
MTEETTGRDLVIVYEPSTDEALGLYSNRPGGGTMNAAASCAKFDELWRARVQALYPDVEIREGQHGLRVVARNDDKPQDNDRANAMFQACQREAVLLRHHAEMWMVPIV